MRIFEKATSAGLWPFLSERVGYARHQPAQREVIEVRTLPTTMIQALAPFAPLFSKRVWGHVQVLLAGTILAPGKRTVTSALRTAGLEYQAFFSVLLTGAFVSKTTKSGDPCYFIDILSFRVASKNAGLYEMFGALELVTIPSLSMPPRRTTTTHVT